MGSSAAVLGGSKVTGLVMSESRPPGAGYYLVTLAGREVWQEDYYDTLIRDKAHLKRPIRYTSRIPSKRFW